MITQAALRPGGAIDHRLRPPSYRYAALTGADHGVSVSAVFSAVLHAEKCRPAVSPVIAGVWPRVP